MLLVLFLNSNDRVSVPPEPGPVSADGGESPPAIAAEVKPEQPVEEPPAAAPPDWQAPAAWRTPIEEKPRPVSGEIRTLRGRMDRADGKPLVNPHVLFLQLTKSGWTRIRGRVAPDGTFEIPDVPTDLIRDPVTIDAGAGGFLTQSYPSTSRDLDLRDLRIVLTPPVRFHGRFIDEAGKPVAGSRLWAFYTPYESIGVTSDAEGRFSFVAPARHRLLINVSHISAPPDQFQLPEVASGEADLGDIRVVAGGTVRGRVLTAEGLPVAGAKIHLMSLRRRGRYTVQTGADKQGRFEFTGVGAGLHEAYTTVKGEQSARAVGLVSGANVDLVVRPRIYVLLRPVHVATGERIPLIRAGATIRKAGAPEGHGALRIVRQLTDEVKVWVTEPGQYDFALCDPLHAAVWVTGVEVRADRENVVTIRLRPVEDG